MTVLGSGKPPPSANYAPDGPLFPTTDLWVWKRTNYPADGPSLFMTSQGMLRARVADALH